MSENVNRLLAAVMPRLSEAERDAYTPHLTAALREFDIVTHKRQAAFMAQLAHESGQLRWWEELWEPTSAQKRYEGRRDLGNVAPGDGYRYRGRGPVQLTGRANYRRVGRALGLPLEVQPDLVKRPSIGFRVAGYFWEDNGLNALADRFAFAAITKRINGGYNGLAQRLVYYRRALAHFKVKP